MDFADSILDIEGYSINSTVSPYPMKILVPKTSMDFPNFIFVAPRTNDLIDIHGGFFLTYFVRPVIVYG